MDSSCLLLNLWMMGGCGPPHRMQFRQRRQDSALRLRDSPYFCFLPQTVCCPSMFPVPGVVGGVGLWAFAIVTVILVIRLLIRWHANREEQLERESLRRHVRSSGNGGGLQL